jgi:hypothetical protein
MQTMHKQLGILVLFGLLTTFASSRLAQGSNIQFDEWGNGTDNGTPLPPFSMATEPLSGMTTLVYQLPFSVRPGDLVLNENTTLKYSDIIRFDNNSNGGLAYFFSDLPDEIPAPLADVGLPPLIAAQPTVFINETGPEGSNSAFYVPGLSDPGYPTTGVTATYNIISDSAPEPSTFALLGVIAISLLGYGWRRRRGATA